MRRKIKFVRTAVLIIFNTGIVVGKILAKKGKK